MHSLSVVLQPEIGNGYLTVSLDHCKAVVLWVPQVFQKNSLNV